MGVDLRGVVFVCIVFRVALLVGGAKIPPRFPVFAGVLWCLRVGPLFGWVCFLDAVGVRLESCLGADHRELFVGLCGVLAGCGCCLRTQ